MLLWHDEFCGIVVICDKHAKLVSSECVCYLQLLIHVLYVYQPYVSTVHISDISAVVF